jgi:hypothetical protein
MTMRSVPLSIIAAVAIVASAATAGAAKPLPAGWVRVEFAGFTMGLPKEYREFLTRKFNVVKDPAFGAYGFMSKNAGTKIYIRYNKVKPEPIAVTLKRGIEHLKKKTLKLEKLNEVVIPPDDKGRFGAIMFFKGYAPAVKKKGKEKGTVQHYLHMIIRGHLRMPKLGAQVSVTHQYRGDKVDDPKMIEAQQKFFFDHISTFDFKDPKEVARLIKVKIVKDTKEVNLAKGEVVGSKTPAKPAPKGKGK